jgi:uracil-DNA glycosylase family 4
LSETRTNVVFGVGDPQADLMFVGEGPGEQEDLRGEPFVGRAGQLLTRLIEGIGLTRADVYIANVVKCRPPGNRTPTAEEALACAPFLDRQIELIAPRLIVALGKSAATRLLGTEASLASLRGKVHDHGGIPVVVTYHPSYLLRSLPEKAKAWEDLVFARRVLAPASS